MHQIMRRLPDGTTTRSVARYLSTWKRLGTVMKPFGFTLHSFDPSFTFQHKDTGECIQLNVSTVQAIRKRLKERSA